MDIMTNKDMIKSILDDTDKLVEFLIKPRCRYCIYCDCVYCNCDTDDVCISGIKKWLECDTNEGE